MVTINNNAKTEPQIMLRLGFLFEGIRTVPIDKTDYP